MKLAAYYPDIAPGSDQIVQAHLKRVTNAGGIGVDTEWLGKTMEKFLSLGEFDNLRAAPSPRFGYMLENGKAPMYYDVRKGDVSAPMESMRGTVQANPVKGYTQLAGTALGYFGRSPQPIKNHSITIYQVFQLSTASLAGLFGLLWDAADTDTTGEYTLYLDRRNIQSGLRWSASRGNQNSLSVTGDHVPFDTLNGSSGLVVLCQKMGAASSYFRNQAGSATVSFEDLYRGEFNHYGIFSRTKSGFSVNGRGVDTFAFNGVHNSYKENQIYDMLLSEYNNT